jgi:hypothetical protein
VAVAVAILEVLVVRQHHVYLLQEHSLEELEAILEVLQPVVAVVLQVQVVSAVTVAQLLEPVKVKVAVAVVLHY